MEKYLIWNHVFEVKVSDGRSFRAHRSLGMLMLQRKHYDISYQHLKRSLELQPINVCFFVQFQLRFHLKTHEELHQKF